MTEQLVYQGKVAGVTFSPAREGLVYLTTITCDLDADSAKVVLIHDKTNQFDKDALRVVVNGVFCGYVPKPFNNKILGVGLHKVEARFNGFNRDPSGHVAGISIDVVERNALSEAGDGVH